MLDIRQEKTVGNRSRQLPGAGGNRKLLLFVLSIILGFTYQVKAESAEVLYKSANQFYKHNQFEQAAASYEKILAQGYHSAEVYYNLGNCYFKLNNTGKSILNYERAHKFSPDDDDINHNFKIAQLRAADKLQPVPQMAITTSWNNFISSQSSKGWGTFALACLWLAFLIFTIYLFAAAKRGVLYSGFLFLFLSVAFISLSFKQSNAEDNSNSAILLVSNVNVKSAPDANGTDIFTIHEGIKLQLLDQVSGWTKIRLADGKVGWIEKNLFEKI